MAGDRLFHLIGAAGWSALPGDALYRPPSLTEEGFIHLSYRHQVLGVANALYRDVDDLVAVEFAPAGLDAAVIDEDSYGSGQRFPHLYGPLPVAAAVAVHRLERLDSLWTW